MRMIDSYNRVIDYLRVSVTDRCNFRCVYCMPEEGAPIAPREHLLTFEEIEHLLKIAAGLGVRKVRLTGGEPLVRRDIVQLVSRIAAIEGIEDLSLTTNGYALAGCAEQFARAGLNRVNISLDTLRQERFRQIARRGELDAVLAGVEAAVRAGLHPVKLNVVAMRGVNDDEAVDFARLTLEQPFDVRFIELMPINWSAGDDSMADYYALAAPAGYSRNGYVPLYAHQNEQGFGALLTTNGGAPGGMLNAAHMRSLFISAGEIRARIEASLGPLRDASVVTNGPARSYRVPGALGTVGFISQVTNDVCLRCNRMRITADGYLRPCLMADGEVNLRDPLRAGATDEEIRDLFLRTVRHKPKEHRLEDGVAPRRRNMSQIGG